MTGKENQCLFSTPLGWTESGFLDVFLGFGLSSCSRRSSLFRFAVRGRRLDGTLTAENAGMLDERNAADD